MEELNYTKNYGCFVNLLSNRKWLKTNSVWINLVTKRLWISHITESHYLRQSYIYIYFFAVSATAFYKCQPVVEFMCEVLRKPQQELQQGKPLSDSETVKLSREIKGKQINFITQ